LSQKCPKLKIGKINVFERFNQQKNHAECGVLLMFETIKCDFSKTTLGKISWKFCIFPEILPFLNNSPILRKKWEHFWENRKLSWNFPIIFPSVGVKFTFYSPDIINKSWYRPYAWSPIIGKHPKNTNCLVLVSPLKVRTPPLIINIFQRFKYRL